MTVSKPNWASGQVIALTCMFLSTALVFIVFLYARLDHDMKLLALGAAISQASALMATASTMLVGRSFEGGSKLPSPSDMPPDTSAVLTESVAGPKTGTV
jgi:hypothetical protein